MKKNILFILCLFNVFILNAQDIMGGQIRFEALSTPLEYQIYIDLYTTVENNIDRPIINMNYGDFYNDTMGIISKDTIRENLIHSIYSGYHHYPGPGHYVISYVDSFWVNDIVNYEGSDSMYFFIQTGINVSNILHFPNSSPYLNYPFEYISVSDSGRIQIDSTVSEPDGDVLNYLMDTIFDWRYTFPSASDTVYMGLFDGKIVWDKPLQTGKYLLFLRFRDVRFGSIFSYHNVFVVFEIDSTLLSAIQSYRQPDFEIKTFPNPASDYLNISISEDIREIESIQLMNTNGQIVKNIDKSLLFKPIHISDLPKGIYFLSVGTAKSRATKKIIIQ